MNPLPAPGSQYWDWSGAPGALTLLRLCAPEPLARRLQLPGVLIRLDRALWGSNRYHRGKTRPGSLLAWRGLVSTGGVDKGNGI
eukprot:scaffold72853_cov33-Prasinocladus_malaysianus.AAC.1